MSTAEPYDTDVSQVNSQVVGAVQASTEFAFGLTTELNTSTGTSRPASSNPRWVKPYPSRP